MAAFRGLPAAPEAAHRRDPRARELMPDEPLPVDVVMVSHVDDDHIKGILELTSEQLAQTDAEPLCRVC